MYVLLAGSSEDSSEDTQDSSEDAQTGEENTSEDASGNDSQLMNRRNQMVQMTVQTVLHRKKTTSARFPLNVLLF